MPVLHFLARKFGDSHQDQVNLLSRFFRIQSGNLIPKLVLGQENFSAFSSV